MIMRLFLYLITYLLIFPGQNFSQDYVITGQIGKFYSAASFTINPGGFIFVSDSKTNEITKLDTLGKAVRNIGGYGWSNSAFDDPANIYANTLSVYICDKNNDRVQIFDKDLNFLSAFSNSNSDNTKYSFAYPTCAATSSQGDFFILDSDNNRIIKYDLNGNFRTLIGSYDSGVYSLNSPKKFSIDGESNLWVIDNERLVVFDQFGNGITQIKLDFDPVNISINDNVLVINSNDEIFVKQLEDPDSNLTKVMFIQNIEDKIIQAAVFNSKLYVLLPETIYICEKTK